jgi:hypothetical protein
VWPLWPHLAMAARICDVSSLPLPIGLSEHRSPWTPFMKYEAAKARVAK